MSAATHEACNGCQWQHLGEPGSWCYMFGTRPIMLPCTQHDKFKETREMIAAVIQRKPEVLNVMLAGIDLSMDFQNLESGFDGVPTGIEKQFTNQGKL